MANTRFKVDNGLNVVGDSDFFSNVTIARNVTTSNLTVTNRITLPGGSDLNSQLASAANTVAIANNTLVYNARKVKFVDSPSLSVQVADNGTESTFSFTVASVVPGAQGYQGIQGAQGVQGLLGIQGAQGIQGRQGAIGIQGNQGFQGAGFQGTQGSQGIQGSVGIGGGVRHTFDNSSDVTVNPGTSKFRFNINSVSGEPSIQEITFNDIDLGAANVRTFITTWDDSTTSPGGYLIITDNTNQKQIIFNVTAVAALTGYTKVTVSHVSGVYPINGAACKIEFARTGNFGAQGYQGVQGAQGVIGIQGVVGVQGLIGFQGIQGAQGRQGTQGIIGIQGTQGVIGIQGVVGSQGIQGSIGIQGTQGTAGPSTTINAADDTTTATLYPVFVGAAGSAQTAKTTTSKILFNAASGELKTKLRSYTENVVSSTITTTYTADLSQSNIFDLTLISGSTTITFTNAPAPGTAVSATLILRQPGAVSNTVSYANTVNWSFSEAPLLCTGPTQLDTVTLITLNGGTTFFATHALANVSY